MRGWISADRAWKKAKRTHQLEHASGIEPTLSCDAVGHIFDGGEIDSYCTIFDPDLRRKFCIATNRRW